MADHIKEYTPDKEGYEQSLKDLEEIEPAPKPAYSKVIVLLCILTTIGYTVTCFVFLWNGKPLNDYLTGFFFLCYGFEFGSLAFIKNKKLKYGGGKLADKQLGHVEVADEEETETKGETDG